MNDKSKKSGSGASNSLSAAEFNYQHEMEKWRGMLAWNASIFNTHMMGIVALSTIVINSVILANGAAVVAILALLGSIWSDPARPSVMPGAIRGITIFSIGIFTAMLTAGLGYLGQMCYKESDGLDHTHPKKKKWLETAAVCFHVSSILAGAMGIVSFALGAIEGIGALEAAGKIPLTPKN